MSFYNDSKFHMWRACIGVVWIDGDVDAAEEKWVKDKIEKLKFTPEQKEILYQDLKHNIDFALVLSKITDKRDRAFLAHQMRRIGHLDEVYCEHERNLFNEWNDMILDGLDLQALEQIIAEDEKASYHEDEVFKTHNKHSIFERMHMSAKKILNAGDYVDPKK